MMDSDVVPLFTFLRPMHCLSVNIHLHFEASRKASRIIFMEYERRQVHGHFVEALLKPAIRTARWGSFQL